MDEVSTIGIDIAKSVFQVHGVDTDGAVVIRKRIVSRAMCQNSVGTAKIEPAIKPVTPGNDLWFTIDPP